MPRLCNRHLGAWSPSLFDFFESHPLCYNQNTVSKDTCEHFNIQYKTYTMNLRYLRYQGPLKTALLTLHVLHFPLLSTTPLTFQDELLAAPSTYHTVSCFIQLFPYWDIIILCPYIISTLLSFLKKIPDYVYSSFNTDITTFK